MRGLFVYDFQTTLQMKRTLLVFGLLIIFYLFLDLSALLVILVMTLLMKIAVVKVEEPTGKFLFTLPFSDSACAAELYLYPVAGGMLVAVLQLLIELVLSPAQWQVHLLMAASSLSAGLVMISVMIPAFLIFGTKNAGVYVGVILAVVLSGAVLITDDVDFSQFIPYLSQWWLIAIAIVLCLAVSYGVSLSRIRQKTY
ncbi:ABC-2 transporter permease [Allobaculum sp. JKK-2023]|uniref:ABC-2 transporter permease n=1 Tax=Allobaculum sp. JKK-2023 TaxID=3108943 RepID=UPI002B05C7D7|nr:ABC-2 transporter permease [Allobaculum sp. JKK-2023]